MNINVNLNLNILFFIKYLSSKIINKLINIFKMKLSILLLTCLCGNALSAAVLSEAKPKSAKQLPKVESEKKDDVEPFVKEVDMRKDRSKPNVPNAPAKTEAKNLFDEQLPQSKFD